MKIFYLFAVASISLLPGIAQAQNADCNALARDLVVKNFQSNRSDYSKLLFLSTLTQMDFNSSKEALEHSGQVSVGPFKIGPGNWTKEKQSQLSSELQKYLSIEQLTQSAASVSIYSGDQNTTKVVSDCLQGGGFFVTLNDLTKDTAVVDLWWVNYPGGKIDAIVESVIVVHGALYGETQWAKKGAQLIEKFHQQITIKRDDPKEDLAVVINTANAGSSRGYLPPSILPPPPPPKIEKTIVEGEKVVVGSGGRYAGGRNPCPGAGRTGLSCVRPQHGGTIIPKSGKAHIYSQNGNTGKQSETESPQEYCVVFFASTRACEAEDVITGAATATEEYTVDQ
jgi:hypothetical protein